MAILRRANGEQPRRKPASRITCIVHQQVAAAVAASLQQLSIAGFTTYLTRAIHLRDDRPRVVRLPWQSDLAQVQMETFRVVVPRREELRVLAAMIGAGELDRPGQGTIFAERIDLFDDSTSDSPRRTARDAGAPVERPRLVRGLMGVTCIVQRGMGNAIARIALDLGASVPVISFGEGTGLRDRLGLLRVTIPAEKDVVDVVTSQQDAHGLMEAMIGRGRLDQPGRGFLALYPIQHGLINTRLHLGRQPHVATIDQIVTSIDEMQGTIRWRRRLTATALSTPGAEQSVLSDFVDLSVVANEGRSQALLAAAFAAGAGGATTSKLRYVALTDEEKERVVAARERTNLVVPSGQQTEIVERLVAAGLFSAELAGHIEAAPCPRVFTYSERARRR